MDRKFKTLFQVLSYFILISSFFILCFVLINRMSYLLDSDISSELVLSKLLADEGRFVSTNWFYSTEIRIFNSHILFTILFYFFNNWMMVRIIGQIIIYILLLLSYYYLLKQMKCEKYFALTGSLLLMPFSIMYFNFSLKYVCYIPYIILEFLTLGVLYHYVNTPKNKKIKCGILLFIGSILGLLAGLNGIRQVILFYLPLFVTNFILLFIKLKRDNFKKNYKKLDFQFIVPTFLFFISSIIGYILNSKVLSKFFFFESWNDISYKTFDLIGISQIFNGILNFFGFRLGKVFSLATISNGICLLMLIVSIISIILICRGCNKKCLEACYLPIYINVALVIFILLYTFTDLIYADRYNILILVVLFPIYALVLQNCFKNNKALIDFIAILLVFLVFFGSIINYKHIIHIDRNSELIRIEKRLHKLNYNTGYATFWYGNVLTELSNGRIDVYCWVDSNLEGSYMRNVKSVDTLNRWLQKRKHFIDKPKGKIFMLFRKNELDNCVWKDKLNSDFII